MSIHFLYKDFFKFLDAISPQQDIWELYNQLYLEPHQYFLTSYWQHFSYFDSKQIEARVRQIKKGDYSQLRALSQQYDLEELTQTTIEKASRFFPAPLPEIYLMVGFFSSDGFVFMLGDKPVIGFGLERFSDFNNFEVLLAHEYHHYYHYLKWGVPKTGYERLLLEGKAVEFTSKLFPKKHLSELTFISRQQLHWCQQQSATLLQQLHCGELSLLGLHRGDSQLGLPPRLNYYLGYLLVTMASKGTAASVLQP